MLKGVVTGAWSSFTVVYGVRINLEKSVTGYIARSMVNSLLHHHRRRVPPFILNSTLELNRLAVTLTEAMQNIHGDRNHVHTQGSINHLIS